MHLRIINKLDVRARNEFICFVMYSTASSAKHGITNLVSIEDRQFDWLLKKSCDPMGEMHTDGENKL
jgi:hypothetical protein